MMFEFGSFELDLATRELRRDGRNIALQPRVFGTLRYLVEHRDRVVTKQELIDALWGGHQLNAVAVPWTISRARKALAQGGKAKPLIETVRGAGYRFVGEIRQNVASSVPPAASGTARSTLPPPTQHFTSEPFVGRELIVSRLTSALDGAADGQGTLHLLTGEAGIGKTRCVNEFATLVRRRGLHVWLGRCFEAGVAPAFWPFIQILRAACADPSLNESARREAEGLLRALEPHSGDAPSEPEPGLLSEDARFWLLDGLSRWLCRCARTQTRVVVIDDVHAADESSLRALALLAPLLDDARVLVIVTARDPDGSDPAGRTRALMTRLCPCEHWTLTGWRRDEVESYLVGVLGEAPAAQLSQALYARSAGNPLFVRELVRLVRAQHDRDGSMRVDDVRLPEAARELFSARFRALEARTRLVLDAASAIGDEFDMPVLQRATGLDTQAILVALQAAAAANIVELRPDGVRHAFAHPLLREVLYDALSAAKRAELHASIGLALESLALLEPRSNELAYHFHHAPLEPHFERAARYGRMAGDDAMRVLAYDEAVQFYGWALEARTQLSPPDVAELCELLLCSATALLLAGRFQERRAQCERVIALARAAKLPDVLVRAVRLMRPSVWLAPISDPIAAAALEEALALLPESAVEARVHAYALLTAIPPYSSRIELSRRMSDEAVRLASTSSDRKLLLEAQRSRLFALSGPDSSDELLSAADDIIRIDSRPASLWSADAQFARYSALLRAGDILGADRALTEFERSARMLRLPSLIWQSERLRAQRLLSAGRLEDAARRFEELRLDSERLRLPFGAMFHRVQMRALNLERTGRRTAPGSDPADPLRQTRDTTMGRVLRMLIALEDGDHALARREFEAIAEGRFAAVTRDSSYLFLLCQLSLAATALGEREAAAELCTLLQPHAELIALSTFVISLGCVARYLALLEQLLGHEAQAREYFETAAEINARCDHELERLRAWLGVADMLAQSRSQRERKRACTLRAEVKAGAERCGAAGLRAAAAASIASHAQSARPGAPARHSTLRPTGRSAKHG
jgi:DNA-binding winged helix-turn-helix (wHTH) protein